jgi:hypothetical protein
MRLCVGENSDRRQSKSTFDPMISGAAIGSITAQMHANSPWLDDPQGAYRSLRFGQGQELAPGALVRRKSQDLTKIMVQGDKHTSFLGTDPVYGFVSLTLETLVAQAHHIVAGRSQKLDPASTQILI